MNGLNRHEGEPSHNQQTSGDGYNGRGGRGGRGRGRGRGRGSFRGSKGGNREQEKRAANAAANPSSHIVSVMETPLLDRINAVTESYDSTGTRTIHLIPKHPHSPFFKETPLLDRISEYRAGDIQTIGQYIPDNCVPYNSNRRLTDEYKMEYGHDLNIALEAACAGNSSGKPRFEEIRQHLKTLDGWCKAPETSPTYTSHRFHPYMRKSRTPTPPPSTETAEVTPAVKLPKILDVVEWSTRPRGNAPPFTLVHCSEDYQEAPTPCFATPEPEEDTVMDEGEDAVSLHESDFNKDLEDYHTNLVDENMRGLDTYVRSNDPYESIDEDEMHMVSRYDDYDEFDEDTLRSRRKARKMKHTRYVPSPLLTHSLSDTSALRQQVDSSECSRDVQCNILEINESLIQNKGGYECNHPGMDEFFKNLMKKKEDDYTWMLDSGASLHFTYNKSDFVDFTEFEEKDRIPVGTATTVAWITGFRTILLNVPGKNNKNTTIRLSPVHYIPNLTAHLLSLGMFLKDGMKSIGDNEAIVIKQNNSPWLTFTPRHAGDTIYILKSQPVQKILGNTIDIYTADYTTMHRRFGHPSDEVLSKFPENTKGTNKVPIPSKKVPCKGCSEGKMSNRPFPIDTYRASKKFQHIHSDVKSFPIHSWPNKFKYFVTIYDDYSSFTYVICIKQKDHVLKAFKDWHAVIKTRNNGINPVQKWTRDGGGEFNSKAQDLWLKSEGIEVYDSTPHTPQQNGRAERLNRTLMEKSKALRFNSCIPRGWWEHAVAQATHLYNRTPVK